MEWKCIVIYRKLNGVDRTIRSGEWTQLELACYSLSWNHQCLPQKTTESLPNSSSGRHCPTYIELPNLHRHQSGCAVRRPAICKGNCNRTYEKKERQIAKFMYLLQQTLRSLASRGPPLVGVVNERNSRPSRLSRLRLSRSWF